MKTSELMAQLQEIGEKEICIKINLINPEDESKDIDDADCIEIWDDGYETCTLMVTKSDLII